LPVKLQRDPFRSLVACMLSAQSPDARTDRAATALFRLARTPKALLALPEAELIAAIKPAGLYNTKARNIRLMCAALLARFGGRVPHTREDLTSLPGVGRKCADIVLRFVFDVPVVAVDTHVHRLCNRLGLARGKTEAQTAASLEPRVPLRHVPAGGSLPVAAGAELAAARSRQRVATFRTRLRSARPDRRLRPRAPACRLRSGRARPIRPGCG
jgi:endonuclease-3